MANQIVLQCNVRGVQAGGQTGRATDHRIVVEGKVIEPAPVGDGWSSVRMENVVGQCDAARPLQGHAHVASQNPIVGH